MTVSKTAINLGPNFYKILIEIIYNYDYVEYSKITNNYHLKFQILLFHYYLTHGSRWFCVWSPVFAVI